MGDLTGGTIDEITNGSIVVTVGTVSAGTIKVSNGTIDSFTADIPGGTIDMVSAIAVATVTAGSIAVVAGTVSAGTINVGTIAAGSIAVVAGTVSAGTINAGTVRNDGRPTQNILSYGTTFGATAAAYGTLVGSAGAGTYTWVNDVSIINSKGGTITCLVGFGTALNGTSVLAKGDFGAQGGIQKSYPKAVNAGMTNQDLVCYIAAAGTIDVNVSYFISA
jgi:hypothetical protein